MCEAAAGRRLTSVGADKRSVDCGSCPAAFYYSLAAHPLCVSDLARRFTLSAVIETW